MSSGDAGEPGSMGGRVQFPRWQSWSSSFWKGGKDLDLQMPVCDVRLALFAS